MRSTNNLIQQATGVYPKHFRPPYGDYDWQVVQIAHELGQKVIMWNIDTEDWAYVDGSLSIVENQLHWDNSAIILMHEHSGISDYLQEMINFLKTNNFRFVNMDEC